MAAAQANAVRRQVERTHAAALHAQLRYPPPLPTPPRTERRDLNSETTLLPPVMPSKPAVLEAHQRALREARLALRLESEHQAERQANRDDERRARTADARRGPPPPPSVRDVAGGANLSQAELIWLSTLEAA